MDDIDFHNEIAQPLIDKGVIRVCGVNEKGQRVYQLVDDAKADKEIKLLNSLIIGEQLMKAEKASKLIKAALKRAKKGELMPCAICNRLARNRGLFVPKDSEQFGGFKHKQRVIMYALCDEHMNSMKLDKKNGTTATVDLIEEKCRLDMAKFAQEQN